MIFYDFDIGRFDIFILILSTITNIIIYLYLYLLKTLKSKTENSRKCQLQRTTILS